MLSTGSLASFDLEATSIYVEEAEIIEIAAQDGYGRTFHRYVATEKPLSEDHPIFNLTKIPYAEYEREKVPKAEAFKAFIEFIGDRRLLGHNIFRYDLPLLDKELKRLGLSLPETAKPALDTLRLAHLVFPTPPDALPGYRLEDLYKYLTEKDLEGAHRALNDVKATWRVFTELVQQPVPGGIARAWEELGLIEAGFFAKSDEKVKALLSAQVDLEAVASLVSSSGEPFPDPLKNPPRELLPEPRQAQKEMFQKVNEAFEHGQRLLIEAPTGTGKTKGYLYPALYRGEPTWVATHTKVLQQQALNELADVAKAGYAVKAALVKSPRDTLCPEALLHLFQDAKRQKGKDGYVENEDLRAAVGVLLHYAARGGYDLEALPRYWHASPGFREARTLVGTNPNRCRPTCPYFFSCAYQGLEKRRREATLFVTNQAYLLTHFLREKPASRAPSPEGQPHLVVDEAHHLEDVATEALSKAVGEEDLKYLLHRLAHPDSERGLLYGEHLEELDEATRKQVLQLRNELLPDIYRKLEDYSEAMNRFLKRWGRGDPRYQLVLVRDGTWSRKEDWPRVEQRERDLVTALSSLLNAISELSARFADRGGHPLRWGLLSVKDELKGALELFHAHRKAMGYDWRPGEESTQDAYLHQAMWENESKAWRLLSQPVDVSGPLQESFWPSFRSAVLTSATLSIPTEKDTDGFTFIKRTLGLEDATPHPLPSDLPYEKAHLIVPRHLPEARESTLPRFQKILHEELRVLAGKTRRSLHLFTSNRRLRDAQKALEDQPHLRVPLTRKEREDVANAIRQNPDQPVLALGSRAYMEGVDFPNLKVVSLERIPFPVPSPLLNARAQRMTEHIDGFDGWWDYYLPKGVLSFVQAFGRLIRDRRKEVGHGAFILWDKKLVNAVYKAMFLRALPPNVNQHLPETRSEFYDVLSPILGVPREELPFEEHEGEALRALRNILEGPGSVAEKARRIAEEVFELTLDERRFSKQLEAITAALEGRDLIGLLPTGYGKSLAFQIAALMQEGLTLVISPLVALMKDQADRLVEKGLPVGAIHSLMTGSEQRAVLEEVRKGEVRLLYVSPERVNRNQDLQKLLAGKNRAGQLNRVVFDEAHCLIQWGFDFRPDYLKALRWLNKEMPGIPKSFFTATLFRKDKARLINEAGIKDPVLVQPESFQRGNLRYFARKVNGDFGKFRRLVQALMWLQDKYGPRDDGENEKGFSAIIYVSTRAEADRIAWALRRLLTNISVEAYHAGLGSVERREIQDRFMDGTTQVVVATTAFGMGIDKDNVRLIVHWRPPLSLEEYLQQTGRAGRDDEEAHLLLLVTKGDWGFLDWMAGVNKGGEAWRRYARNLISLLQENGKGPQRFYRKELLEELYKRVNPEGSEDQVEVHNQDEHEDENESKRIYSLDLGQLDQLLNTLEMAGVLEYEYQPGKALLVAPDKSRLAAHLQPGELGWLERAGYQGRDRGDELNYQNLSPEQAEHVDAMLFNLAREQQIDLYYHREPLLSIQPSEIMHERYMQWDEMMGKGRDVATARLRLVKKYVEASVCRTQFLLKHLGERLAEPCGCDLCTRDSGPWEAIPAPTDEELERAYQPLDTLLAFFARAEERSQNKDPMWVYLGKNSTLLALRNEDYVNDEYRLSPKYTAHPLFGHLSFIREKELERTFNEALKKGYLEEKARTRYGHPLYGLTEKGWQRYRRGRRKEAKHA